MYSARQESASRSQSPSTPLSEPRRRASAATPERQSTVVPKTSNVRARTLLRPEKETSSIVNRERLSFEPPPLTNQIRLWRRQVPARGLHPAAEACRTCRSLPRPLPPCHSGKDRYRPPSLSRA